MDVIARLDREVDAFAKRTRIFNEPMTGERAKMFVKQHRLNSRERNSRLKLGVATNCPDWEMRLKIIAGCAQEIIADNEFGHGRPHWAILEDLGVTIGMPREEITSAEPLPSTQLAWTAWESLTNRRHWLEGVMANNCAERVNVPGYGVGEFREIGWFPMEAKRWRTLFGLSSEQVYFFDLHGPADFEHSNVAWHAVADNAAKLKMEDAVVRACRDNLAVWELYLNGIVAAADAIAAGERVPAATA